MNTAFAELYDFEKRALPSSPNYCLVDSKVKGGREIKSPIYAMPVSQLKQKWQAMILKQPRVETVINNGDHYQYIQRSKVFKFPDLIDVVFISLPKNKSTLKIFSRSLKGYYDFGVNCHRLRHWLPSHV